MAAILMKGRLVECAGGASALAGPPASPVAFGRWRVSLQDIAHETTRRGMTNDGIMDRSWLALFHCGDVDSRKDDMWPAPLESGPKARLGCVMSAPSTQSALTRHAELLRLCARIGYSPPSK